MLRVRNCDSGYGKLRVLKNVSLHVAPGEIVAIIGPNGAGKSTLLHTVSGLLKARSGEILLSDRDISGRTAESIVSLGCSLVPEGRQVFSTMTVRENLLLGSFLNLRRHDRKASVAQMSFVLELFPVLRERQDQLAGTLSGGEQQMLAIGRGLMTRPRLLMMDEPSMGIAPLIVKTIFKTIEVMRDGGTTILLVEQNARASLAIADRGYVLETGQIVLEGTAQELLDNRDVQRAYLGKEYKRIDE
jgi:branched-chain amino acid transport system ATP-binding protein